MEEKKKRTRGPRRNYEKELKDVMNFCEVSIEVLSGLGDGSLSGKIEAYRSILSRINGNAKAVKKGEV